MSDGGGWMGAAMGADGEAPQAPSATATPQATPQQEEQQAKTTAALPAPAATDMSMGAGAAPAMPAPTAPVVTSNKPGGIRGLLDTISQAISGKTKPEMGTDDQGNQYVKQVDMSGAERWIRAGVNAFVGAGAGLAAGRGGNPGAAIVAGAKVGQEAAAARQAQQDRMQKQADNANQQTRQAVLDKANSQLLTQKIAMQAMDMAQMQVKGTREAIDFSEKQQDYLAAHSETGKPIAYAKDPKELAQVMNSTPGFHENHIQNSLMQPVQLYDQDGKANGFAIYQLKAGTNDQMAPAGATVYHYDAVNDKMVPEQTAQPMRQMDLFATNNAAAAAMNEAHLNKAKLASTEAEAGLKKGQTAQAYGAAAKDRADVEKAKTPAADDPRIGSLGEAVARGTLSEDTISKFDKGTQTAVQAYLTQHHPNLDQKSVFLDGGQRKQANLASNALENLKTIQAQLQRRPDLLGVINGRLSQGKELTGTNDPDLAALNTELDNYGLASTGAHGIRAVQARADAKKALLNGFKNGPEGVAASIGAARMSLTNLASVGKPRGADGSPYVYNTQQGAQPAAAPGATPAPTVTPRSPAVPAGAAGTAINKADGKPHYVTAAGQDLGVVQ